jgi:ATP-dependent RNA helicase DDX23/PRP28
MQGIAVTFLTGGDTEVYYDLKKLLEECKASVPPELARHEASKNPPGAVTEKRKEVVYLRD